MRLYTIIISSLSILTLGGCAVHDSTPASGGRSQGIDGTTPSPCAQAQGTCAPFGPVSEGFGCPAGMHGTDLSCSTDGPVVEEICCMPDEPDPSTDCEQAGGVCAPFGPIDLGFGCPQNTTGSNLSCNPAVEEVCCMPAPTDCRMNGCAGDSVCTECAAQGTSVWTCVPDGAAC